MSPHTHTAAYIALCWLAVGAYIAREQGIFDKITELMRLL